MGIGDFTGGDVADQSPPSNAEVKKSGATFALLSMSLWYSACLIKHRENFTFFLPNNIRVITSRSMS
jgi:hypothetical protein